MTEEKARAVSKLFQNFANKSKTYHFISFIFLKENKEGKHLCGSREIANKK